MSSYSSSSEATCPHCDAEQSDAWELFDDMEETVETECESCEKEFSVTRSVVFYYSASAIEEDDQQ